jgi:hypothetical protein
MALKRMVKRGGMVAVAIGLVVAAANSAPLRDLYQDVFPTDPAKRMALEFCFLQDHKFNRLDSAARAACYSHALMPATAAAASQQAVPRGAPVNFVDLQRDAAQGRLPANDVRLHERNELLQAR